MSTRHNERYLSALSAVITGGLVVDDEQAWLKPEQALLRSAGALLRAVTMARFGDCDYDSGADGWSPETDALTDAETIIALSSIGTMLSEGQRVIEGLRERGEWRSSGHRIEHVEAMEEHASALRADLLRKEAERQNEGSAPQPPESRKIVKRKQAKGRKAAS